MYTLASTNKQNKTSAAKRQNKYNTNSQTLQRKSNDQNTEALSQLVSNRTPVNALPLSSRANLNSQSSYLSYLVKNSLIQAKLKIGKPNDVFEQEADRAADEVMRMPEPIAQRGTVSFRQTNIPYIQRPCPECEEELHRQPTEEEEVQAKNSPGQAPEITPKLSSRVNAIHGSGQQLPESVRAFFEPRFGRDFSQVRFHTDVQAAKSARTINARAFTVGRDVVFGAGHYAPETINGKRLIAHELAHVVQQRANDMITLQRQVTNVSHSCKEGEGPPAIEPADPGEEGEHPLIYRGVTKKRSRRPAVGDAQQLLNRFLDQLKEEGKGKFECKTGAKKGEIQSIRKKLRQDPLEVDCRFGPNTEKATIMFQHCVFPNKKKEWDGKIGPNTWPELDKLRKGRGVTPPPTKKQPPPSTSHAIRIDTKDITGPIFCPCGLFFYEIAWLTEGRDGYIVQEINISYEARNCDGDPDSCAGKSKNTVFTPTRNFWEAWTVDSYRKVSPTHDIFALPFRLTTCGRWEINSKVYFVKSLDPEAEFKVGKVPESDTLSTAKKPKNLGPVSKNRDAAGEWNCCGKNRKHTPGGSLSAVQEKSLTECKEEFRILAQKRPELIDFLRDIQKGPS
jgi:hypothetical protein